MSLGINLDFNHFNPCPKCNHMNVNGSKVCKLCGKKLKAKGRR